MCKSRVFNTLVKLIHFDFIKCCVQLLVVDYDFIITENILFETNKNKCQFIFIVIQKVLFLV